VKRPSLILTLFLALSCGMLFGQDNSKTDWNAEYKRLLESDPGVLKKIESGQATKEDVIRWLQETRGKQTKVSNKKTAAKDGRKKDLSAFKKKLNELVKSGKLSKEEAAKLAATMRSDEAPKEQADKKETVDWDAAYEKLLSNPAARQKIEQSGTTKEQVIEFLKKSAAAKNGKGNVKGGRKVRPGAREGSFQFYSLVIGRLKSKDVELGEMEIDVDYVISEQPRLNAELVGRRVKLVGVSGQFLDALLQIKRGETIKVRTGDFNPETKVLGFGYKFHVLERTAPFKPGDFGVPPMEFRGFSGELTGKIVEAAGYEVLLEVQESIPADDSKAKNAESILGKRIRIAGFYNQHADAFADLREGDMIRAGVAHRNSESDALDVTDVLKRVQK